MKCLSMYAFKLVFKYFGHTQNWPRPFNLKRTLTCGYLNVYALFIYCQHNFFVIFSWTFIFGHLSAAVFAISFCSIIMSNVLLNLLSHISMLWFLIGWLFSCTLTNWYFHNQNLFTLFCWYSQSPCLMNFRYTGAASSNGFQVFAAYILQKWKRS